MPKEIITKSIYIHKDIDKFVISHRFVQPAVDSRTITDFYMCSSEESAQRLAIALKQVRDYSEMSESTTRLK